MVSSYQIDPSRRLATVTLSGTVHGYEIAASARSLYTDPKWVAGFDVLSDGTAITELLFEKADVPAFVQLRIEYAAVSPRYEIILVNRVLDRAMAQMYATLMKSSGYQVQVCQSQAEVDKILAR